MTIEIQSIDLTDRKMVAMINQLQKEAYQIEARLTGIKNIPYLTERDDEIVNSTESFLGHSYESEVLGIISYQEVGEDEVQICRLAVSPSSFGKGIGLQLILAVFSLHPAASFVVTTGKGNSPAKNLYEKSGFVYKKEIERSDGTVMWKFEK